MAELVFSNRGINLRVVKLLAGKQENTISNDCATRMAFYLFSPEWTGHPVRYKFKNLD
jgi:hypothetical protein